jgi:hypothetical protein
MEWTVASDYLSNIGMGFEATPPGGVWQWKWFAIKQHGRGIAIHISMIIAFSVLILKSGEFFGSGFVGMKAEAGLEPGEF